MKKKRPLSLLREIALDGCMYYTVISLLLYIGGMMFSTFEKEWIPTLSMLLMLLIFTMIFSAVNRLVLPSRLPAVLKLLIHYAVTTLFFYIIFILWGGYSDRGSGVLLILLVYTFVYIVFALIRMIVLHVQAGAKNSRKQYDTQFKKNY